MSVLRLSEWDPSFLLSKRFYASLLLHLGAGPEAWVRSTLWPSGIGLTLIQICNQQDKNKAGADCNLTPSLFSYFGS